MSGPIERAWLCPATIDKTGVATLNEAERVTVSFNPESLKVTYANAIKGEDKASKGALQYLGAGSTKLAVTLWFDATAVDDGVPTPSDALSATAAIKAWMGSDWKGADASKSAGKKDAKEPEGRSLPQVAFVWGLFQFVGVIESLEETLEYFTASGVPLRASLNLTLTQQRLQDVRRADGPAGLGSLPGTVALTPVQPGITAQKVADNLGYGKEWQEPARQMGVENPRILPGPWLAPPPRRS